jgi:site-specific DNA-methyltransferase (adenine-specific)
MDIKTDNYFVMQGNCLERLKELEDNSIDSVITDPPYELGFMGKKWDNSGIAFNVDVWLECLRVLKPGGHLLAFGGTRTWHRLCVAIEDAGFEVRDSIAWLYGSGFPKSHNIEKSSGDEKWAGWGTALKPAFEPIVVARKPVVGTVANNVLKHGTGGLNIDATRIEAIDQAELEKNWDRTQSESKDGFVNYVAQSGIDLRDYRPIAGRWPANILLDEFTADLVDDQQAGASRFFYTSKASKKDRNEGLGELPQQNFHPTVKPTDLMRYLVKLVTPPNGTVLDPFTGSGSTGKAALLEGNKFIGVELTEEYFPIIKARLEHASGK